MNRSVITVFALLFSMHLFGQNFENIRDIKPNEEFDNIWAWETYSDSLSTTYVIWIKKGVKLHKHEHHTENIYVLSGTGDMQLGEESLSIIEGDLISIPMNVPHSLVVTSPDPVKIISVQSPKFLGKDRTFIE